MPVKSEFFRFSGMRIAHAPRSHQPSVMIVIVGGPSGCGKSTVGQGVAKKLGLEFVEGDALHPAANVEKMSNGIPLTDDDRWGWLQTIADKGKELNNCVIACSALKKSYRDLLVNQLPHSCVVLLVPTDEELVRRLETRKGHFFKVDMLKSQLATLERPHPSEKTALVVVPKGLDETVEEVVDTAKKILAEEEK